MNTQLIPIDLSVYLLTKPFLKAKEDYFETLECALKGGVSLLQWREKEGASGELYRQGKAVQHLAKRYQTPLIVNDRLDLALAIEADGLHVGQEDLPVRVARKLLGPDKILGVSAGNLKEALQAEQDGADYLGVGAVFPTGTKQDATPISFEAFQEICQKVTIPVVAIGGIVFDKVAMLKSLGAKGVAVISAVWDDDNPKDAVQKIKQEMKSKVEHN